MSPAYELASGYPDVFAHFDAEQVPECSVYLWSPVFPCVIAGRPAVIKRARRTADGASAVAAVTSDWAASGIPVVTPLELSAANPVQLGEVRWVAYPFVEGRGYEGRVPEIEAAGTLLGRIHAREAGPASARLPVFRWPPDEQAREETDLGELRTAVAPHASARVFDGVEALIATLTTEVLPPLRAAELPCTNVSMDYKASNLIYGPDGPVLIDPDNGDFAPRLLDLAQAALLFHTDHEAAPARPFDQREWSAFRSAYLREVELTDQERLLWPRALDYMLCLEGHWAFTGTPQDWDRPRQRSFLLALAGAQAGDFPLP